MGKKKRNLIIKKAMVLFISLALMVGNGGSLAAAGNVNGRTTAEEFLEASGLDYNGQTILGNGTDGIYIDIGSEPYRSKVDTDSRYDTDGCAWFASTRAYQLMNWTGAWTRWTSTTWWNNCENLGLSRDVYTPTTKALACFYGIVNGDKIYHIAVVENVSGNTYTISEGGRIAAGKEHGYCAIRKVQKTEFEKENSGTFFGYVYLGVPFNGGGGHTPTGHIDSASGGEGKIYVGGWALDPDSPSTPVQVNLYIAGISDPIASFNTHDYRDIAGGVNCGFEEIIDVSGKGLAGWRDISLWAIDVTGDENAGIGDARIEILPDPDEEVPHNDCEMQEGIDKIKDGNYVFASAYSLDDETNKLNDNPYVMETDENDVVVTKGLSADSTVWVVEYAQYKRFYSIRSPKKAKGNMQLESEDNNRKTNIKVGRWKGEDCTCYWVFDEKNGMYRVKNMHSGMCATKSDGNSVKQLDWKDGNTDAQLWLLIEPDRPTINTSSIPDGTTGKAYNTSLSGKCDEWVAIKWNASNLPAGLSMSPDGVISGTPTEAGDFNVKVDATNFFGTTSKTYNIVIEETYIPVTGVTLPENETVEVGSNFTLTPNIIPSNATDKTRTWVSSEPAVATVNENGVVTGVKEGQTEITVTTNSKDGSHSAKCTVTVSPKPIPFVPGDVTMDGYVYMDDVLMLSRAVAGTYTLTEEQEKRGDVTGDQKIGMNDVVKVARFVAGTLDSL